MKPAILCATVWFVGLWIVSPAFALTVRVDSPNGTPRILVNGEPVRARMFWGAPGSAPIRITPDWSEVSFDFVAGGSAANGTMHFRFGDTPGDVFLDDIHVVDLDEKRDLIPRCDFESGPDSFSRDWTFWPTGAKNTAGAIQVEPGEAPMPRSPAAQSPEGRLNSTWRKPLTSSRRFNSAASYGYGKRYSTNSKPASRASAKRSRNGASVNSIVRLAANLGIDVSRLSACDQRKVVEVSNIQGVTAGGTTTIHLNT